MISAFAARHFVFVCFGRFFKCFLFRLFGLFCLYCLFCVFARAVLFALFVLFDQVKSSYGAAMVALQLPCGYLKVLQSGWWQGVDLRTEEERVDANDAHYRKWPRAPWCYGKCLRHAVIDQASGRQVHNRNGKARWSFCYTFGRSWVQESVDCVCLTQGCKTTPQGQICKHCGKRWRKFGRMKRNHDSECSDPHGNDRVGKKGYGHRQPLFRVRLWEDVSKVYLDLFHATGKLGERMEKLMMGSVGLPLKLRNFDTVRRPGFSFLCCDSISFQPHASIPVCCCIAARFSAGIPATPDSLPSAASLGWSSSAPRIFQF